MSNTICVLCENPVRGSASVTEHGVVFHLCHPDDGPDCYHLWTVYGYRPSRRVARWLNDWPSDGEWDYRKARGVVKWTSSKRPEEVIREMRDAW
jgi:hypothetical protein